MKTENRLTVLMVALCALGVMLGSIARAADEEPPEEAQPRTEREEESRDSADGFVGTPLPDLTVYDASGNPFELSRLKGRYSVLVFGCLT